MDLPRFLSFFNFWQWAGITIILVASYITYEVWLKHKSTHWSHQEPAKLRLKLVGLGTALVLGCLLLLG
jgi:hypothetical protein